MSQHHYQARYDGPLGRFPVEITLGWDRPLGGYFANVESVPLRRMLYCNLDDATLPGRFASRVEEIEARLATLGLSLPSRIWKAVAQDGRDNVGNRVVDHGAEEPLFQADERDAILSFDQRYRYALWRRWSDGHRIAMFVMLNPSTADALKDDPTIRRVCGYAKSWGYNALVVTNLFGLRSTSPNVLKGAIDPVGPDNDEYLQRFSARVHLVVAAWGAHGSLHGRDAQVREMIPLLHYLRLTKEGAPAHPLYLRSRLEPTYWPSPQP